MAIGAHVAGKIGVGFEVSLSSGSIVFQSPIADPNFELRHEDNTKKDRGRAHVKAIFAPQNLKRGVKNGLTVRGVRVKDLPRILGTLTRVQ